MTTSSLEYTARGVRKATAAEPIKDRRDIERIKQVLNTPKSQKYYVLFMTGIYCALRISDILKLQVKTVKTGYVYIHETKTRKAKQFKINPKLQAILDNWIAAKNLQDDDYIFYANGHKERHIDESMAYRKIKAAVKSAGVDVHYSNHTLRKTASYHAYMENGKDITLISHILNHSSPAVTMAYIGLTQESVDDCLCSLDF